MKFCVEIVIYICLNYSWLTKQIVKMTIATNQIMNLDHNTHIWTTNLLKIQELYQMTIIHPLKKHTIETHDKPQKWVKQSSK